MNQQTMHENDETLTKIHLTCTAFSSLQHGAYPITLQALVSEIKTLAMDLKIEDDKSRDPDDVPF